MSATSITMLVAMVLYLFGMMGIVWTQALADLCGLHRTYISDLENAKCNPTLSVLLILAASLGVKLSDLLGIGSK